MRIWETGNPFNKPPLQAGFTLIELLAVITLIGFMIILAYPRVVQSVEQNELTDISRLLAADLEAVRVAAITGGGGVRVSFNPDGYSFSLGEQNFTRRFTRFQFRFELQEPEPDPEPGISAQPPAPAETSAPSATETPGGVIIPNTLEFTSDGNCGGLVLNWHTVHLTGKLSVGCDGVAQWDTAPK